MLESRVSNDTLVLIDHLRVNFCKETLLIKLSPIFKWFLCLAIRRSQK